MQDSGVLEDMVEFNQVVLGPGKFQDYNRLYEQLRSQITALSPEERIALLQKVVEAAYDPTTAEYWNETNYGIWVETITSLHITRGGGFIEWLHDWRKNIPLDSRPELLKVLLNKIMWLLDSEGKWYVDKYADMLATFFNEGTLDRHLRESIVKWLLKHNIPMELQLLSES